MRQRVSLVVVLALVFVFLISSAAVAAPPEWAGPPDWVVEKQLTKHKSHVPPGHLYRYQNMHRWCMICDCPYADYKDQTNIVTDVNADVKSDQITISFTDEIQAAVSNSNVLAGITITNLATNEELDIDDVYINDDELQINLADELEYNTKYKVVLKGSILEDNDGDYIKAFSYIVTTDKSSDSLIDSVYPKHLEKDVDVDTDTLTIEFKDKIQAVTDMDDVLAGITVRNITDNEKLDIYDIDIDYKTLTIELDDELEYDCKYRVTIAPDILETTGGTNLAYYSWVFYTED